MTRIKERRIIGFVAGCLILLSLITIALARPVTAREIDIPARTVVWSEPQDPYYDLAREIARAEGLLLADALDAALAHDPEYLLWVVAPERLSEEAFSGFGAALQRHGKVVSVGLISGSTIDTARALWQCWPDHADRHLSIVPREGQIDVWEGSQLTHYPLTIEHVVAQIERADYVMFQGHGSRRYWRLDETTELVASNLPSLPPQVIAAGACQTFKLWSEDSIALAFTDRGAAAYVGFLHSPHGYLVGDPKGSPFATPGPTFLSGMLYRSKAGACSRALSPGPTIWYWAIPASRCRLGHPTACRATRWLGTHACSASPLRPRV